MKRTFKIYRYDPDKDAKPYMQTIQVELDGTERMLRFRLDALLKAHPTRPPVSFNATLQPSSNSCQIREN